MVVVALICALFLAQIAQAKEIFREQLNIYKLERNFALLNFDFNIEYDMLPEENDRFQRVDYFPQHFIQIVKEEPSISEVEFDLVQGRWNDAFMKRVNGFDTSEKGHVHYRLDGFNN